MINNKDIRIHQRGSLEGDKPIPSLHNQLRFEYYQKHEFLHKTFIFLHLSHSQSI